MPLGLYLLSLPLLLALHLGEQLGEAHIQRLRYAVEVNDADVTLARALGSTLVEVERERERERMLSELVLAMEGRGCDTGAVKAVLGG